MITLYHFPLQPHCRKIRLALGELKLACHLEEEPYWEKNPEFLILNPAADVPVLQEESGYVVAGNYPITEYLEDNYSNDKTSLIGNELKFRTEVRRLADWFDRKFYQEVSKILIEEKFFKRMQGRGSPDTQRIRQARTHAHVHFKMIGELTKEAPFMVGESVTLADLAAAAQISVMDYFGEIDWRDYTYTRRWYRLMKSRPAMRAILAERVRGITPPAYYADPDF